MWGALLGCLLLTLGCGWCEVWAVLGGRAVLSSSLGAGKDFGAQPRLGKPELPLTGAWWLGATSSGFRVSRKAQSQPGVSHRPQGQGPGL